ncbi:hypothetical protein [Bacillus pacificus]|nr:hypothetical protein [Bacillus pacificus]
MSDSIVSSKIMNSIEKYGKLLDGKNIFVVEKPFIALVPLAAGASE